MANAPQKPKANASQKALPVEATQKGYFNDEIKQEGARFVLADAKQFSHRWMKALGWTPPKKAEDSK